MKSYQHILHTVSGQPWMIRPEILAQIAQIVQFRASGGVLSDEEIRARLTMAAGSAGPRGGARSVGAVGIIPVYGAIFPRANMLTEFSGGATVAGIRAAFRQALADEAIGSILFDIDSPGGMVDGVEELATEIRHARGQKPIVAIADYVMGSAAYYLGAQADEVVASPSAQVGWIGTVMTHIECSKANEMEGITATVIRNPAGKFGANSVEPLSEKALAEMQQIVDDYTLQFETAAAQGRGVSLSTVRRDFGEGGGMTAARAKVAGLVDRVATIDETIQRMATGKVVSRGTGARSEIGEHLTPLNMATLETVAGLARNSILAEEGERPDDAEPGEQAPDDTSGLPPAQEAEPETAGDDVELLRIKNRARSR